MTLLEDGQVRCDSCGALDGVKNKEGETHDSRGMLEGWVVGVINHVCDDYRSTVIRVVVHNCPKCVKYVGDEVPERKTINIATKKLAAGKPLTSKEEEALRTMKYNKPWPS